jgi:hypothetical protein
MNIERSSPWCLPQVPTAGPQFSLKALLRLATTRFITEAGPVLTETTQSAAVAQTAGRRSSCSALKLMIVKVIPVSFYTTHSQKERNNPTKAWHPLIQVSQRLSMKPAFITTPTATKLKWICQSPSQSSQILRVDQRLYKSEGPSLHSTPLMCSIGELPRVKSTTLQLPALVLVTFICLFHTGGICENGSADIVVSLQCAHRMLVVDE